jgi:hypothetical protein
MDSPKNGQEILPRYENTTSEDVQSNHEPDNELDRQPQKPTFLEIIFNWFSPPPPNGQFRGEQVAADILLYLEFCASLAALITVIVLYCKHGQGDPYWCDFRPWIRFLDRAWPFALGCIITLIWKFDSISLRRRNPNYVVGPDRFHSLSVAYILFFLLGFQTSVDVFNNLCVEKRCN